MRKTTIALFALAAVGLAQPTAASLVVAEVAVVTEAALAEEASMAVDLVVEASTAAAFMEVSRAMAFTVEGFAEDFTDVRL